MNRLANIIGFIGGSIFSAYMISYHNVYVLHDTIDPKFSSSPQTAFEIMFYIGIFISIIGGLIFGGWLIMREYFPERAPWKLQIHNWKSIIFRIFLSILFGTFYFSTNLVLDKASLTMIFGNYIVTPIILSELLIRFGRRQDDKYVGDNGS
jgi:hypothetical protein